jgi:aerotaxis receptor
MRRNQPVTNTEQTFDKQTKLISVTDLQGNIIECNEAFVSISGFSREELIGQPHNIVRHPDMPELAFETMWKRLKEGKAWMGLVKNRCKNGDFYWVDAYVTPVIENRKIVGYESVRTLPERAMVERAQALYSSIHSGKSSSYKPPKLRTVWPILMVLSAILIWFYLSQTMAFIWLVINCLGLSIYNLWRDNEQLSRLEDSLSHSFCDEIATQVYTTWEGKMAQIQVRLLSEKAHLDTVITRIENSAKDVSIGADGALIGASESYAKLQQQQLETEQVATAMNEMSTTINDVSGHVQSTANEALSSLQLANESADISKVTKQAILELGNTVGLIRDSVLGVSKQTARISDVAQIINQIAEQTNLLALNAAIEAARAGEQGRGFAVVADEVRHLAQRTQQSTQEIHTIIHELMQSTEDSVEIAQRGQNESQFGIEQLEKSTLMLEKINGAIENIHDMSTQIAASVEEQAAVSDDINQQVVNIASLANTSLDGADNVKNVSQKLTEVANDMYALVVRFKR